MRRFNWFAVEQRPQKLPLRPSLHLLPEVVRCQYIPEDSRRQAAYSLSSRRRTGERQRGGPTRCPRAIASELSTISEV